MVRIHENLAAVLSVVNGADKLTPVNDVDLEFLFKRAKELEIAF